MSLLDHAFESKSIAVIGASADERKEKTGWVGRLQEFGYPGKIYPINPGATMILGLAAYASIKDVPDPVDLAIINVRAPLVPQALKDCIAKKVTIAHIYTAGFKETRRDDGLILNSKLEDIINSGGIRVIGPNCMGIYCPDNGITFSAKFSKESGPVGVVSQSGAALMGFIPQANKRGIFFSKVASYGNGIDLDGSDFLEYLSEDEKTRLVFCYLEGVNDGRRFLQAVQKCALRKPVIILKGGMTKGGKEAVSSHTASLAGSEEIWKGIFKQNNIVQVESFDEAVEQIIALQHVAVPKGRAVGIVARGGGPGIVATDHCERMGLFVPALNPETILELEKIADAPAGSSLRNPVELGLGRYGISENYEKGLKIVASDPHINLILTQVNPHQYTQYGIGPKQIDEIANVMIRASKALPKPMVVVMPLGDSIETMEPVLKAQEKCIKAGLAIFSDLRVAIKAISNLINYYEHARQ